MQPERTRLAWRRTTLSWAVVELLVVRQGLRSDGGVLRATVVGLAAFAFVAFLWLTQRRMLRLGAARPAGLSARAALSVVGCTMALAVFGAVLIF
ncbi:DUF202 domain-containing protein [Streptomyces sp. NBC_01190]|nr:DUF202 domain-containing protein [Streptomyces sp. NBC_01190]